MTDKQQIFCDEYLKDRNGTRAYKAAYPNVKKDSTARVCASQLLTKPNIRDYIDEQLKKLSDSRIATVEEIFQYLTSVLRGESRACELSVVPKGGGVSEVELSEKPPTEKERLEAAKQLAKLLPTMGDSREQELKIKKLELEIAKLSEEPDETAETNFIEALNGEADDVWR